MRPRVANGPTFALNHPVNALLLLDLGRCDALFKQPKQCWQPIAAIDACSHRRARQRHVNRQTLREIEANGVRIAIWFDKEEYFRRRECRANVQQLGYGLNRLLLVASLAAHRQ